MCNSAIMHAPLVPYAGCVPSLQSIYIQVTASLQQWSIFRRIAAKHGFAILQRGELAMDVAD